MASHLASIIIEQGTVFASLPTEITVSRYHSVSASRSHLPETLATTAETADGVIMAVEHKSEPVATVQLHPESIMMLGGNTGMRMLENVVAKLTSPR